MTNINLLYVFDTEKLRQGEYIHSFWVIDLIFKVQVTIVIYVLYFPCCECDKQVPTVSCNLQILKEIFKYFKCLNRLRPDFTKRSISQGESKGKGFHTSASFIYLCIRENCLLYFL